MSGPQGARRRPWAGARRLVRHPVSPLVAEGFLSRLSFGLVSFSLPLFAYRQGLSLAGIGVLLSLNLMVAIALKPLAGAAADRFGLKPALVVAIALRSVVTLLFAMAAAPWQLFAARAVHGASIALRDPAATALVADAGGERRVATSFAWYQTAKTLAGSLGRAAAGMLLALGAGHRAVFVVAFALSVLPLGVVMTTVPRRAGGAARPDETPVARDRPQGLVAALPLASVGFLVTGSAYLMANLFPLFATEHAGLSPAAVGGVYLLGAALALSGPAWGWLADRCSHHMVLSLRSAANVGSSLLYLVSPTLPGVAAGKALDDAGKAAFRPAWGALMAQVANQDRSRRARVLAWLTVGEDLGEVTGPLLAGLLWSVWGIPAVLGCRVVLALTAEVATIAATRRYRRSPAPSVPAERQALVADARR